MSNKSPEGKKDCAKLSVEESSAFRDELRSARENCVRDAEAFDQLLFAVERLGSRLLGRLKDLGTYGPCLFKLAEKSHLAADSAQASVEGLPFFPSLFSAIREARNSALHQGAVARHLTTRAIELALVLEDALAIEVTEVQYLMVRHPVVAMPWQTLAAIRQLMLANAFSFLPIHWKGKWRFVTDYSVAMHLRSLPDPKNDLATPIEELLAMPTKLHLLPAKTCRETTPIHKAIEQMANGRPVLVVGTRKNSLVGLIAPADAL